MRNCHKIGVWRIRDVYLGNWFLTIPDPRISDPEFKNSNKREMKKKICCHPFFCSHKFSKIANYFMLLMLKKKFWLILNKIIVLFTQKFVTKLSRIWVRDPGSGIGFFRIPSKRHRIPDPDLQQCNTAMKNNKITFTLHESRASGYEDIQWMAPRKCTCCIGI